MKIGRYSGLALGWCSDRKASGDGERSCRQDDVLLIGGRNSSQPVMGVGLFKVWP